MSVEGFIEYYRALGKKIAKPYYYLLKGFEEYLNARGKRIDDFSPNDVEMYMAVLAKDSPRTANMFLSAIRKYAEWRARNAVSDKDFLREERRVWDLRGIRNIRVPRQIKKESLSIEEVKRLLKATMQSKKLFVATVVHFYFGWRPVEGAYLLRNARINWADDYMIIGTAKVGNERILPWAPQLRPIIREWHKLVVNEISKKSRPEEWYTKAIKPVGKRLSMTVTARTARKTFETQMKRAGVEQWAINFLLGHTTTVPDIYTDWDLLRDYLADVMTNKHYLIGVLEEVVEEWRKT